MTRTIMALPLFICMFVFTSAQVKNNSRNYNNAEYTIVNAENLMIYTRDVHITGSKALLTEKKYYFSKDRHSEIKPLTINNLKNEFPVNREFHELIDMHFSDNSELTRYSRLKAIFRKAFNG